MAQQYYEGKRTADKASIETKAYRTFIFEPLKVI